MFESIINFFKKLGKNDKEKTNSKDAAKERLHLVLMQDRANVSADFLDLMKQEIIDVIKKYIDVDENEIDVRLTNKTNEDGTTGAPALYANIPIISIKEEAKREVKAEKEKIEKITESAKEIIENVNKEVEAEKENKEQKEEKIEEKHEEKDEKNKEENNKEEKSDSTDKAKEENV